MENDLHRMVEGHEAVIGWFGEWPSFHDAEVLSLRLNRSATSSLEVLTWRTRSETNDAGHYVRDKFAVITFSLESISSLELTEFNIKTSSANSLSRKWKARFDCICIPAMA